MVLARSLPSAASDTSLLPQRSSLKGGQYGTAALEGMRVAIGGTDDFEQSELTTPTQVLEEAGAQALIVSPASLAGLSG